MAEDDEQASKSTDPDRLAILSRRRHFVAIALSGLAATACTDGEGHNRGTKGDSKGQVPPQPCLKEEAPEAMDEGPAPEPCLSVAPPEPPPQPCLKIAAPDDEGGDSESGDDTGEPEVVEPDPAPRPCLRKAGPKPCLKVKEPDPQPCLEVEPGEF